jgi:hypothetical protein
MSAISADRVPAHWRTGRRPSKPPANPFERTPLARFIVLSMLVHGLFIALFGAPSGGSREGRSMWGSLSVTLQGLQAEPQPLPPIFAPPAPSPAPVTPARKPVPTPMPEVVPDVPRVETPLPVEKAAPLEIPPQLDRITPPTAPAPALKLPPALEAPVAVPQMIDRLKVPDAPPAELKVPPALEAPVVVPSQIDRVKPPERMQELAPAVQLPPLPAPPVAPPVTQQPIEIPAVPIPPLSPPVLQQPIEAPVIPTPAERPAPATAPVEKAAPVESRAVPAPPATAPVDRSTVESRAIPTPPVIESPLESRAIPSQPPIERSSTTPAPSDASKVDSAAPPKADALAPSSPRTDSPLRSPGAGAPGTSPFRTPPRDSAKDYDPTAPGVDVDAAKRRAGEMAREGSGQRALFAMPLPKPKNKMEEAIEKARKPDCRTAYANMGLLAIVPLVANEFGEGNCRW